METNSHPEAAASNVKQGQYSPRKRKDTTPRVNPQLAVELVYKELKRVEVYTKRIEDATARKVQIDGKSLASSLNELTLLNRWVANFFESTFANEPVARSLEIV